MQPPVGTYPFWDAPDYDSLTGCTPADILATYYRFETAVAEADWHHAADIAQPHTPSPDQAQEGDTKPGNSAATHSGTDTADPTPETETSENELLLDEASTLEPEVLALPDRATSPMNLAAAATEMPHFNVTLDQVGLAADRIQAELMRTGFWSGDRFAQTNFFRHQELRLAKPIFIYGLLSSVVVNSLFLVLSVPEFEASTPDNLAEIALATPPPEPEPLVEPDPIPEPPTPIEPVPIPPQTAALAEQTVETLTPEPQVVETPTETIPNPIPLPVPPTTAAPSQTPSANSAPSTTAAALGAPVGTTPSTNPAPAGTSSGQPSGVPGGTGNQAARPGGAPSAGGGRRTVACQDCPLPDYPQSAILMGSEGTVYMYVDIDANGQVTGVRLALSSGSDALDQAALNTVRDRWQFEPIQNGAIDIPIQIAMVIPGSERANRRTTNATPERRSMELPATSEPQESGQSTARQPIPERPQRQPIPERPQ